MEDNGKGGRCLLTSLRQHRDHKSSTTNHLLLAWTGGSVKRCKENGKSCTAIEPASCRKKRRKTERERREREREVPAGMRVALRTARSDFSVACCNDFTV